MDQETRWITKYEEVKSFIQENKRNPSKYVDEERNMTNCLNHTRLQGLCQYEKKTKATEWEPKELLQRMLG